MAEENPFAIGGDNEGSSSSFNRTLSSIRWPVFLLSIVGGLLALLTLGCSGVSLASAIGLFVSGTSLGGAVTTYIVVLYGIPGALLAICVGFALRYGFAMTQHLRVQNTESYERVLKSQRGFWWASLFSVVSVIVSLVFFTLVLGLLKPLLPGW